MPERIDTGSGVLVMAAVLLGIRTGLGIDIDSCARMKARGKVGRNDLQSRIKISAISIEDIEPGYAMVLANLRTPSLHRLCARIDFVLDPHGIVLFSGVRRDERAGLTAAYTAADYECVWTAEASGWAGIVLKKG